MLLKLQSGFRLDLDPSQGQYFPNISVLPAFPYGFVSPDMA